MQAVVLTGHGGPERLEVRTGMAEPMPGVGQVQVAVSASAVNNTDIWSREGAYGRPGDPDAVAGWRGVPLDFPRIQGGDIVGVVRGVGAGVSSTLAGRRVLVDPALYDGDGGDATPVGLLGSEADGGFAQYVVVDAGRVHDVSSSPLSDFELATLPIAYGTAMGMLARAHVIRGEAVVVTGASGGVGIGLVQLVAALGARVIAVSTAAKADALQKAGADVVVDRRGGDLVGQIRQLAPRGVDVVADVVGGETFHLWPDLLTSRGRIVVAGAVAGPLVTIDLRRLYLDQRCIIGSTMHTPDQFRRLVEIAIAGDLAPVIAGVYPLTQIHQALRAFRAPDTIGKIVIEVGR